MRISNETLKIAKNEVVGQFWTYEDDTFQGYAALVTHPNTERERVLIKGRCKAVYTPPQTFQGLLVGWIQFRDLSPLDLENDGHFFKNEKISSDWQKYHKRNANLMMTP